MRQEDLWTALRRALRRRPRRRRIFGGAGVARRHAAVNPLDEDVSGWTTGARMRRYAPEALPLGKDAVAAALADAGLRAEDVGLLTVVSCTGYVTPGLDIRLAADLGMAPDVQRLLVGHMGCYAAMPGLAPSPTSSSPAPPGGAAVLRADVPARAAADRDRGQVVAHALFGDAAAAVVVLPGRPVGRPALRVLDVVALTDPSTADHMTWDVTDLGFRMGLSPEVPDVLARHVRGLSPSCWRATASTIADVDAWAVHPGRPADPRLVADQLELPPGAVDASREVLADRGNCSSTTVLLVLDALRAAGRPRPGRSAVVLAFGPGLTLYAALLRAV